MSAQHNRGVEARLSGFANILIAIGIASVILWVAAAFLFGEVLHAVIWVASGLGCLVSTLTTALILLGMAEMIRLLRRHQGVPDTEDPANSSPLYTDRLGNAQKKIRLCPACDSTIGLSDSVCRWCGAKLSPRHERIAHRVSQPLHRSASHDGAPRRPTSKLGIPLSSIRKISTGSAKSPSNDFRISTGDP